MTQGRLTVETVGTTQRLSVPTSPQVHIRALNTNSNRIALGNEAVSAAFGREQGLFLLPGEEVVLSGEDLTFLWVDALVANDGLTWWASS